MCGYCGRPCTRQPEGDWACSPCRALMAKVVVGPGFEAAVTQYHRFVRMAARTRPPAGPVQAALF